MVVRGRHFGPARVAFGNRGRAMAEYERQIVEILSRVGDKGISVQMLSKHLYNMNCGLFDAPDLCCIRSYVQRFLLRNAKSPNPLVERTDRRGYYRLCTSSYALARQLMLEFNEEEAEGEPRPCVRQAVADGLSPSLFDFAD